MNYVHLLILFLAFLLFAAAGLNVSHPKVSLGWLGLAVLTIWFWMHR